MPARLPRIGSAAAAVSFARVFSLVAAIVQLPILTRMLTTADYALVSLSIAGGLYFSLVSAEPTILPFQRFPGTYENKRNFSFALKRLFMCVGLFSVLVMLGGLLLDEADVAFGLLGWGCGVAFNRFVATAWIMWEKPWPYCWTLVLGTGVRIVALVGSLAVGLTPALAVGLAGLLSGAAVLAVVPWQGLVIKAANKSPRPWKAQMGISLALASMAFTVLLNMNLLILPLAVTTEDVGIYAAMNQVATLTLGAALGVINTVIYPKLQIIWNSGGRDYVFALVRFLCTVSLLIGVLTVGFVHLFGAPYLEFFVGNAYSDVLALELQLTAVVLSNVGQYLSWIHLLTIDSKQIQNVSVLSAAIGSIGSLFLVATYGLTGAGVGMLFGFFIYAVFMSLKTAVSITLQVQIIAYALLSSAAVFGGPTLFVALTGALAAMFFFLTLGSFRATRRAVVSDRSVVLPRAQVRRRGRRRR